ATVSDSGLVTCTGDGIAYISATTMDSSDISATCILNCIDGISYLYSTENILRMTTVDGKVI
ncbi:MAG: hypothetical protein Q4D33_06905, partial [Prevotellaceae bacterium]|nr:hypothetical protein [Prevotellaceae bacterium]